MSSSAARASAGLFLLLTLYCAIRGWSAAAVAACALGMGSKETMIVAPALVVLWDYVFRAEGARRLAPMLLAAARGDAGSWSARCRCCRKPRGGRWSRACSATRRKPRATRGRPWSYLWTQAGRHHALPGARVQAVAARVRLLRLAARALAARRAAAGAARLTGLFALTVVAIVEAASARLRGRRVLPDARADVERAADPDRGRGGAPDVPAARGA